MKKNLFFVFTGEFGYELLNWQGVVRKLRTKLPRDINIIACSRIGLGKLYETCNSFFTISDIDTYVKSFAQMYWAIGINNQAITNEIYKHFDINADNSEIIYSNIPTTIEGLRFGEGCIYDKLDINNNEFKKIECDFINKEHLKKILNFDIEKEPYLLVQSGRRNTPNRSSKLIDLVN